MAFKRIEAHETSGRYKNLFTNTMHLISLIFATFLCLTTYTAGQEREVAHLGVVQGKAIAVDGELSPGEWDDAGVVTIEVTPNWKVPIRYKYDRENLNFAFSGLNRGAEILYPEVLIDSRSKRSDSWAPGVWWFHASNNLCEADGAHDVYNLNGVLQCSHTKPGWSANNPPSDKGVVEFRISLSKVSLNPDADTKTGLAFDVTNATGNDQQRWSFWPPNAELGVPSTWAEAVLTRSNLCVSSDALGGTTAMSEKSRWYSRGQEIGSVHGYVDVGLASTPSANTLPIRRLNLGAGEISGPIAVVWIQFPKLTIAALSQNIPGLLRVNIVIQADRVLLPQQSMSMSPGWWLSTRTLGNG